MFREIQDQTLPSLLVTYLLKFTVILVVRHHVAHLIYKIGSDCLTALYGPGLKSA